MEIKKSVDFDEAVIFFRITDLKGNVLRGKIVKVRLF